MNEYPLTELRLRLHELEVADDAVRWASTGRCAPGHLLDKQKNAKDALYEEVQYLEERFTELLVLEETVKEEFR